MAVAVAMAITIYEGADFPLGNKKGAGRETKNKFKPELRSKEKLASCITVKIRYADFNTYTRQLKIPYTANENILGRYAKDIFSKVYERRQMIRLIGVKFSGLVQGKPQISLFDDTVEEINLLQEVDHIRKRFGIDKIMRASSMNDMVNNVLGMAS